MVPDRYRLLITVFIIILGIVIPALPVSAAIWTLDPATDTIQDNITLASDGDTLILNPGTYSQHSISISKNINIKANASAGGNAANTIIDAGNSGRIFNVNGDYSLVIDNLTLRNGNTIDSGGAVYSKEGSVTVISSVITRCLSNCGGAVRSHSVTLVSSEISDCTAAAGGAITSNGTAAAISSVIRGCRALDYGGAVYLEMGSSLTVLSSTIADCRALGIGGDALLVAGRCNVDIHFSRIYNCSGGVIIRSHGAVDASNNWWGTNSDPSEDMIEMSSGTIDVSPWLVLGITADPPAINPTGVSAVRANLTYNSDGEDTSGSGDVPDGIPVTFAVVSGPGSLASPGGSMISGAWETMFTPADAGLVTAGATVDGQTVYVPVAVKPVASFMAAPLAGTAPLDVAFTESSMGSPESWNWSFGDGEWFNTTDSALAEPVHTYTGAGTYTVSLTVSRAGLSDILSRENYITVSSPASAAGGSGSSSGGGSNTDTGTGFSTGVKAGSSTSFGMDKGAINKVVITAGTDLGRIMITVRKDDSAPSSIVAPGTDVYEYEDVNLYYAEDSDLLERVFFFKVKKSWLSLKGYGPGDIAMLHYSEEAGEWEELTTMFAGEDGAYYYYTAKTPSFSWFAIAVSEGATIVPEEIAAPASTQVRTKAGTLSSSAVPDASREKVTAGVVVNPGGPRSWASLAVPALFIVLVIIVIAGLISHRKKEEFPEWWDHGLR